MSNLVTMLQRAGLLPEELAARIREYAHANKVPLVEVVVDRGVLTEEELVKFLQSKLMIPEVEADLLDELERETLRHLPAELAWYHEVMPVSVDDVGNLTLAMTDPTDLRAVDAVAGHTGAYLVRAVAPLTALRRALERYYGARPDDLRTRLAGDSGVGPAIAGSVAITQGVPTQPVAPPSPVREEAPVAAREEAPYEGAAARREAPYQEAASRDVTYEEAAARREAPHQDGASRQAPHQDGASRQASYEEAARREAPYQDVASRQAQYEDAASRQAQYQDAASRDASYEDAPAGEAPHTPAPTAETPASEPPLRPTPPVRGVSTVRRETLAPAPAVEEVVPPLSPIAFARVLPRVVAAADRDEITQVLLDFLAQGFSRVIMFVHLQQQLRGRDARGDDLLLEAVTQVRIPTTGPSLFRDVIERGAPHFGPWRIDTKINAAFDQAMGGIKGNVLLLPVKLRERVPILVYASNTPHPVDPHSLHELVDGISGALERLIFRRKSLDNIPRQG